MKKEVEILVRAVIQDKEKILVCEKVGKNYYFFPGGHLNFGESTKKALIRELKEELGLSIKECSFIGGSEHRFIEDGKKHHEINLVFNVSAEKVKDKSLEDHIDFVFLNNKEFKKEKVLPLALQKNVIRWLKNKKIFWASQKVK